MHFWELHICNKLPIFDDFKKAFSLIRPQFRRNFGNFTRLEKSFPQVRPQFRIFSGNVEKLCRNCGD